MATFRITLVAGMYGQECQNVFHLSGPNTDPNELSVIADHVAANWIPEIRAMQSAAVVYTQVRVRLLESQFPTFTKAVNLPGINQFDDELSTVLSWVLQLRTAELGKRGRGRLYIPGVMKGWTKNGLVIADQISIWNNHIADLMSVYGPNGSSNYRLTICPSKPPFSERDVTGMQIATKLGTQRRRNIGVGV